MERKIEEKVLDRSKQPSKIVGEHRDGAYVPHKRSYSKTELRNHGSFHRDFRGSVEKI